jgi:hypothetical protein
MQGNKQSKPVTRLFRVFFRFLLTLVTMYGVLYLSLLAVTVLMRLKWGYCHWIWWIIRPAPANAFRAGFTLIRLHEQATSSCRLLLLFCFHLH